MTKTLAIIQARMGSSRLPSKVLMDLKGKTVLERVIERVSQSHFIDEIVVATTIEKQDLSIVKLCAERGIRVFCGSENDVLDRYYQCARLFAPENVVRITADCPMIDSRIIDLVISQHIENKSDYSSNTLQPTYPDGLDVEIIAFSALKDAWNNAKLASQREHVTQYIIQNPNYQKTSVTNVTNLERERWTLDTNDDYLFIRRVYDELYDLKPEFTMEDIVQLLDEKMSIREINRSFKRNEGLAKSLEHDYVINEDRS